MFIIVALQAVGSGVITTHSAILIRGFGFTSKEAALLNTPSGVVTIASCLFCGLGSRFHGHRWAWTTSLSLIATFGACLMAFLPTTNKPGLLVGIYLLSSILGPGPVEYQWAVGNTAGITKRAFVSAALNAAFAVGNIIGPQTFRSKDAPGYRPAKVGLVCCWAVSVGLAWVLIGWYMLIHKRRDGRARAESEEEVTEVKGFASLTDKENLGFRYQY